MASPYLFKLAMLSNSSSGVMVFVADIDRQDPGPLTKLTFRGPYLVANTDHLQPLTASAPVFADGFIYWAGATYSSSTVDAVDSMALWKIGPHFDLCSNNTTIREQRLWQDTRYPKPADLSKMGLINTERRLSLARPGATGTTILCHFNLGSDVLLPVIGALLLGNVDLSQQGDDGQWYRLPINASPLSTLFSGSTLSSRSQYTIIDSYDPGCKYVYVLAAVPGDTQLLSVAQILKSGLAQLRKDQYTLFRPFDLARGPTSASPVVPLLTIGKSRLRRLYLLTIDSVTGGNYIIPYSIPLRADGSIDCGLGNLAMQQAEPILIPGGMTHRNLNAVDLLDGRVMFAWEDMRPVQGQAGSFPSPNAMIGELGTDGQLPGPGGMTMVELDFPVEHASDAMFYSVLVPKDFE